MTARALSAFVVLGALLLGACGSSDDVASSDTSPPADPTTTTVDYPCGPSETDCTPAEVVATVAKLYEDAGATPEEAACLAPITADGAHAVNEAFGVPTADQTRGAVACVGSKARLGTIGASLADVFSTLVPAPGRDSEGPDVAAQCDTWRDAVRAASAVFYANRNSWPTKFADLTDGPTPTLELTDAVRASGRVITGPDWTLTMSGNGVQPTFTCDPA